MNIAQDFLKKVEGKSSAIWTRHLIGILFSYSDEEDIS